MIGVLVEESKRPIVCEFFELFKTPWEFYHENLQCDVLICANGHVPRNSAKLLLIYGGRQQPFDQERGIQIISRRSSRLLSIPNERLPIYGECAAFDASTAPILVDETTKDCIGFAISGAAQTCVRMGFDLFEEVRLLLTNGQPVDHADVPTIDLHIALLRSLILCRGICLLEIPPVPHGYNFIACLTHDVDHAGIRQHRFDHTMFGFLFRATFGSIIQVFSGRKSLKQLATNWMAAFSLPFIHLGLAEDFWKRFDRYLDLEQNAPSTFFVIPTKGNPGVGSNGASPRRRAAQYDLTEIGPELERIVSSGGEIGCHGIDAWYDSVRGTEELQLIRKANGRAEIGMRSHWLYFYEGSPRALEDAGFAYDSSIGYNETIGYRAGTSQIFKPVSARKLLELPLHIMDTALFYSDRMNLTPKDAQRLITALVDKTSQLGGVLTVNWHDRSIAPERLWGNTYRELLVSLRSKNAWLATAGQAVAWFKRRRLAKIDNVLRDGDEIRARVVVSKESECLPGLIARFHESPSKHIDVPVTNSMGVAFTPLRKSPSPASTT